MQQLDDDLAAAEASARKALAAANATRAEVETRRVEAQRADELKAAAEREAEAKAATGKTALAKTDGPTTLCQQGRAGHKRSGNVSPARSSSLPARARHSQGPRLTSYRGRAATARVTSIGGGASRV